MSAISIQPNSPNAFRFSSSFLLLSLWAWEKEKEWAAEFILHMRNILSFVHTHRLRHKHTQTYTCSVERENAVEAECVGRVYSVHVEFLSGCMCLTTMVWFSSWSSSFTRWDAMRQAFYTPAEGTYSSCIENVIQAFTHSCTYHIHYSSSHFSVSSS